MNTDNNDTLDQTKAGKASPKEANGTYDIFDEVDSTSTDDSETQAKDKPDLAWNLEETEDDIMDLTDLLEEPAELVAADYIAVGQQPEEAHVSEDQGGFEEGPIIELFDEVLDKVSPKEEVIDLSEIIQEPHLQAKEEQSEELVYAGSDDENEEEEERLLESLGLEMADDGAQTAAEAATGRKPSETEELVEEFPQIDDLLKAGEGDPVLDLGWEPTTPSAAEIIEGGLPSEPAALSTDVAVESMVLEEISHEKIEAVIRSVITESIEKKAERVLLEVAEAAIAREIERIKQAL